MKYGRLNFLSEEKVDGKIWWNMQCDCGSPIARRKKDVVSGNTSSCGCIRIEKLKARNQTEWFRGFGEITGTYLGQVRNNARKRNLIFNVTNEYLWNLYLAQNKLCALTGLPIDFNEGSSLRRGRNHSASLDRINSTDGYIEGNVQWVHKDINFMKSDYSQEEFIKLCKLVALKYNEHPSSLHPW